MKYLKYFESEGSLFSEIETDVKPIGSPELWTNDDKIKIERIIRNKGDKWSPEGKYVENPIPGKHRRFEVQLDLDYLKILYYFPFPCFSSPPERHSTTTIKKFEDEWFVYTVPWKRSGTKTYLVDGWDGMEEIIMEIF